MLVINYLVIVAALTLVHVVIPSSQAAIEVTNEQLRDGLLSLVHSYSQLENKLDRHEQRERALGEIIKRGLQTLQKGQKIFEPMRGTFSRLDERIGQIETILLGQDDKFNEQQTTLNKALELIDKWVGSQDKTVSKSNDVDSNKLTELSNQVEDLSVNVKELRKELDSLASKHDGVSKVSQESFTELGTNLSKKLEQNADAIAKIQEKIGSSKSSDSSNSSWEDAIAKELQQIKSNLGVAHPCSDSNGENGSTTDKDFFIALNNQTLDAIGDMRHEVLTASDKNQLKTTTKLKETTTALETSVNDILKNVGESSCDGVTNAIADVKQNINELHKLEQMLAQMGDNVLSIKRGMEFNVHAITLEVSDAIKLNSKELNQNINNQFEAINETILTNHNGALTNLTSKIETEISQVWRQIGIMYQEVSSSKDALNKLQELTEVYSNGTLTTMDSMEGKVSQITNRMSEVDSNLNYLLGRLSLVTQEFNQIKVGLGSALDNIRNSFQIVQNKIEVVGPGPHKIESEENHEEEPIPDFKLLPQRDQPAP